MFIRKDLPLAQQIVQAAHATLEAGLSATTKPTTPSHLIMLTARDEPHLLQIHDQISMKGISTALFYEPDDHLGYPPGYTAFATHPLNETDRHHFKKYKLWKEHHHD